MKKRLKYIVLVISTILIVVALFCTVGTLVGINDLNYPSTAILPTLSFTTFIVGFTLLIIWGFKFSDNKPHKKMSIISTSVILLAIFFLILSPIVNGRIGTENKTPNETINIAEEFSKEYSNISEDAKFTIFSFVVNLDIYFQNNELFEKTEQYPYIKFYYEVDNEVKIVSSAYKYNSDIALDFAVYYNIDTNKITKVEAKTNFPKITEEAIINGLVHVEGFTNSYDINETVTLKKVLAFDDESFMVYEVSKKWQTTKSIYDTSTVYIIKYI